MMHPTAIPLLLKEAAALKLTTELGKLFQVEKQRMKK